MRLRNLLPLAFLASPTVAFAQEAEVVVFDVGQGDATLILSPSGQNFLIDGGTEGRGASVIVPFLQGRGITHIDYICATHYHKDHIGGLKDLPAAGITVGEVLDRGDVDVPTAQYFTDYQNAFAGSRRTLTPGEVIDLGGDLSLRCLAVNARFPKGIAIDISGSPQQENSASICWKLTYDAFDMFVGGDMTGGSPNSENVELPVARECGKVDVYRMNFHGSGISSTGQLLRYLRPEFALCSVSSPNSANFPRQEAIDRINLPERTIPVWSTSAGNGGSGFVDCGGTITITTSGQRYTARMTDGTQFTAICDDAIVEPPAPGGVLISELMRDPGQVTDFFGEWLEITGTKRDSPIGLRGLQISNSAGEEFVLGINITLDQAEAIAIGSDGMTTRNGGYRPIIAWPTGSFSLSDDAGEVTLVGRAGNLIDHISYDNSWPNTEGVSLERIDMLADATSTNFSESTASFGAGDLGTPGKQNSNDQTEWSPGGDSWVQVITPPRLGQALELRLHVPGEVGQIYQGCLSFGTVPGTLFDGVQLPINSDSLFNFSSETAGWRGMVPANEKIDVALDVPLDGNLVGLLIYTSVVTIEPGTLKLRTWANPITLFIRQ